MKVGSRIAAGAVCLAMWSISLMTGALPAQAYGNAGHMDVYQIAVSFNCDNPTICGSRNLGGFWGWAELDHNLTTGAHTGDAQFAGCGHGTFNGAAHDSQNITNWYIAPGSAGPKTFYGSGTDTRTIRGTTTVSTFTNQDFGVRAVAGHYSTSQIFGFSPPPGVSAQIQVAFKPAQ